jgi:hypothetical protein
MLITKLIHSCLLIQKDNIKILVDPGNYSWQSGLVSDDLLDDINFVVITHIHPDHFDENFVKQVSKRSPHAVWYSTPEIVSILKKDGINAHSKSDTIIIKFIKSDHANLDPWYPVQPEHTSFLLFGELLTSGDHQDHETTEGARILAGAFNGGPWGAAVGTAKMLRDMSPKPKKYIPLHDWHLKDDARLGLYERAKTLFSEWGIEFVALEDGKPQEV